MGIFTVPTHECGYGFHAGVGACGPKNTCGLPVTNTKQLGPAIAAHTDQSVSDVIYVNP
jgi:hypothetical protein